MTEKELFKMMEAGQVVSAEVLPKVAKEMKKAASAGGALDTKLKSVRVTQGQFFNELALSSNTVFGNGYSSGLGYLFETLTETLKNNQGMLEDLGNVFGAVFRGIANVVRFITPYVQALIGTLDSLVESLDWLTDHNISKSNASLLALGATFLITGKYIKSFALMMYTVLLKPLAVLYAILGAFDEVRAFFDESVVGMFDDKKWTPEQSKREHARRRQMFGYDTEEDRAILGSSTNLSKREQALLTGNPMQGGVPFAPMDNPASRSWLASIFGDVSRDAGGLSSYDRWKLGTMDTQKAPVHYVVQNLVIQAPDSQQAKKSFMEGLDAEFSKYRAPSY